MNTYIEVAIFNGNPHKQEIIQYHIDKGYTLIGAFDGKYYELWCFKICGL